MGGIKDKVWLWGHPAGSHNFIVKKFSRITPAEACYYMDIKNLIFVRFYGNPPYFLYEKYAISFEPLKNVIWSIVGANGETSENDFEFFLKIAEKFKNIKGAITDDFFYNSPKGDRWAVYDLDYLKKVKNILKSRSLELWGVLYYHQVDLPLKDYIDFFDVITLWIWEAKGILKIGDFFDKFKKLYPSKRSLIGIYLWDYGGKREMPLDLFEYQFNFALNLLSNNEIEGIIFLASCICDLKLKTVEYVRERLKNI